MPKSVVRSGLEALSVENWHREWDQTTKGKTIKEYFPVVAGRLNRRINITNNFTTVVTGHVNIKSYQHHFKIIDSPKCSCGKNDQTTHHLLLECTVLNRERERESLISAVSK